MYKNLVACEHCGRVLVDNDIAAEFEKKAPASKKAKSKAKAKA